MPILPERAHLDHLKKQAKDLLRRARGGDVEAIARLHAMPARLAPNGPRLHDAQSCIARDYGFRSWLDLATHVEAQDAAGGDRAERVRRWLLLVYGGGITSTWHVARPRVAAQVLRDSSDLVGDDPYLACAAGDLAVLRRATEADPAWVNRPGGPLRLPPLFAVTHSGLAQLPDLREHLHLCARHLLEAGADPNQPIASRRPPASLAAPDESTLLSALYGAAGVVRDPALTALLLEAGADPDDGESLYHSLENPACTRVLLAHGARIAGTNALGRALDMTDADALELLLAHGGDANEPPLPGAVTQWGGLLPRAIGLRSSTRHIATLLAAGADPRASTPTGISAYKLALQVGRLEVADMLRAVGAADELTEAEAFVAACARADADAARAIQARRPDLPGSLPAAQLRLLPDTVAWGSRAPARVMVELGWPLDARGGDWDATALHHAVFQGDSALTAFLLARGANRHDRHGHGGDALDALGFASLYEPTETADWAGCARALLAHGLPPAVHDPADPEVVLVEGKRARFSEEVADILLGAH